MARTLCSISIEPLSDSDTLRDLSNEELVCGLQLATRGERRMTIRVLHHLNEMGRRKLHLDLGYSSRFDYCVRKLRYSASAAGRRIQAARCIRHFPQVLGLLQNRELSLSTISLIEPILTEENHGSILNRVRGASHREVQRIVSEFRPPVALRDRVQPVRVAVPVVSADEALFDRECARRMTPGAGSAHVATEQKLYVQFVADENLMQLFEEVRALVTRDGEYASFADVLKIVLAEYRERHSPIARQKRREAKKRPASPDSRRREWNDATKSRHIPDDVRDDVFVRDRGQCAYASKDGTRCESRTGLQVDHIKPFAVGGSHNPSNLRLLCAAHNRRAAERVFGSEFMQRFSQDE